MTAVLAFGTGFAQVADDSQFGPEGEELDLVRPDTVPTATAGEEAGSDSVSVLPTRSPGKAVLLSALIPGGGQVYTGHWWKAALVAPAEVTLGYLAVQEHIAATAALSDGREEDYETHRDRRATYLWWTGAVVAFSMADAYVSAQMYMFDRQMRLAVSPTQVGVLIGI